MQPRFRTMYTVAGAAGVGAITWLIYRYCWSRSARKQPIKSPKSVASHLDEAGEESAADLNLTQRGWSEIHIACFNCDFEKVVSLVESGAKVNCETPAENWTPLQIAATKPGNERLIEFLLSKGANVNAQNFAGYSPLIIAACNGFKSYIDLLLPDHTSTRTIKANTDLRTAKSRDTALHLAARNGHEDIVHRLVERASPDSDHLNLANVNGALPLHSACLGANLHIIQFLLTAKKWLEQRRQSPSTTEQWVYNEADVDRELLDHTKRDGCTVLHTAAGRGASQLVRFFTSLGCNLNPKSRFGTTPLHEAASGGLATIVEILLSKGADVKMVDSDGLTPLHSASACTRLRYPSTDDCRPSPDYARCVSLLLEFGADVNARDNGDGTPLHLAAGGKENAVPVIHLLLEAGANVSLETCQGWTALHVAHSDDGHPKVVEAIGDHLHADFMATFVRDKPKRLTGARSNQPVRTDVFPPTGRPTLEALADKIRNGQCKNIVVLTGAGISVSAGIPDFRSPKSGIYSDPELKSLPNPSAVFDINYIRINPQPFLAITKKLFLPVIKRSIKPTATHYFVKLLHDKGLLLRNYTQNIDTLEHMAGIPSEKLVEAHGSFSSCRCSVCSTEGEIDQYWDAIENGELPVCSKCDGFVRPDVVFFGESLPGRFSDMRNEDLKRCDLFIVIGTSLSVYPVAGLVNEVSDSTPRLLINRDAVGAFTAAINEPESNYRDLSILGECDDGVKQLAELLGWSDELEALMRS